MAFKNFKLETDADGIALITWDIPGRSMNVLDETSAIELETLVKETTADAAIKGVVITSAKEAFCAGADLSMLEGMNRIYLDTLKSKGEEAANQMLFDNSRRFSQIYRAMETSGKPWVAAINGLALGGGFELTLACHHRVAAENPKTRLGLPEIKVGLFPGAGGTQRVPRIVQPQDAMNLLLKGEALTLDKAKAMKLVDAVVPAADLIKAAKDWIKAGGKAVAPWDEKGFKLPGGPVFSKNGMMMFPAGNAIYRRETYDNYPAARAIMSCVYEGLQLPIDAALRVESRYFSYILRSKEAAAMIRSLFLSMQELNKGARRPADVPATKLKKIAVIGAGFMGASVGYVSARGGLEVVLIDRDQESADKGRAHAQSVIDGLVKKGRAKPGEAEAIMGRITAAADYAVLKDCDLVIEAVFEDRNVKAETYAKAQPYLKDGAIFASNTSTLPITSLAEEFKDQGRFVGIHFFSPVDKMGLVEIIMGEETSDEALAKSIDYVLKIKKTPIVVNDSRGFYTSRCFGTFVQEGLEMLADGIAPAIIDNVGRATGMPRGPLEMNDDVALDLGYKVTQQTKKDLGDKFEDRPFAPIIEKMVVELQRFGRKNGKGFYDYPENGPKTLWRGLSDLAPVKIAEADQALIQEIRTRLLYRQAVEAARCFEEGVITDPREADVGAILGWGFAPWTGGPISLIDGVGAKAFVETCDQLAQKYGKRFAPPALLREMAEKGETFYGRFGVKAKAAA